MLKSEISQPETKSELKPQTASPTMSAAQSAVPSDTSQFQPSKPDWFRRGPGALVAALVLLAALFSLSISASAQSFTLDASSFTPVAVPPEGTSSADVTVGSVGGFTGTVNLSCQVIPTTFTDPPSCAVSPATVTAPATASATITTKLDTTTIAYAITITGAAPSISQTVVTQAQTVTVLAVAPQFTISVTRAVTPTSVPAGNGGQGTITINPINGYSTPVGKAGITLSCSSITPLVTIPPICSFTYPNGESSLKVTGTGAATSTITINTFGPVVIGAAVRPRTFYALWLSLPMLGLVGLGAALGGKRSRKAWGLLALFVISGALCLMPACANSANTTITTPNGVTPNNTYTFTVTGVDADGNAASNTESTTTANPSVTLTVTSPTN